MSSHSTSSKPFMTFRQRVVSAPTGVSSLATASSSFKKIPRVVAHLISRANDGHFHTLYKFRIPNMRHWIWTHSSFLVFFRTPLPDRAWGRKAFSARDVPLDAARSNFWTESWNALRCSIIVYPMRCVTELIINPYFHTQLSITVWVGKVSLWRSAGTTYCH